MFLQFKLLRSSLVCTPCNTPATPPNFPDALLAFSRMSTGNDKLSSSPSGLPNGWVWGWLLHFVKEILLNLLKQMLDGLIGGDKARKRLMRRLGVRGWWNATSDRDVWRKILREAEAQGSCR
ncbi:hypothetical protein C0J52_13884 [Blattella germanica]|nr:hypothetical protein C0J52_13884 [Blattella germanica]